MPTIKRIVILGDSLTDRGALAHRKLFGLIPMSRLAGLSGLSPRGRFTNGYTWADDMSAQLCEKALIQAAVSRHHSGATGGSAGLSVSDSGLGGLPHPSSSVDVDTLVESIIAQRGEDFYHLHKDLSLNNCHEVRFEGHSVVRDYSEGGATSHDWSHKLTVRPAISGARVMVSNLNKQRAALLKDDEKTGQTAEQKAQTLVVEWTGANDLFTTNHRPDNKNADLAVKARLDNLQALINQGYRNFRLPNLPDLALTPKFQRKIEEEQENASAVTKYFNEQLAAGVAKLQNENSGVNVKVFDVYTVFNKLYQGKEPYTYAVTGFGDDEKRTVPITEMMGKDRIDYHINAEDHTLPGHGCMFWNPVHPSMEVHGILDQALLKECQEDFDIYFSPASQAVSPVADGGGAAAITNGLTSPVCESISGRHMLLAKDLMAALHSPNALTEQHIETLKNNHPNAGFSDDHLKKLEAGRVYLDMVYGVAAPTLQQINSLNDLTKRVFATHLLHDAMLTDSQLLYDTIAQNRAMRTAALRNNNIDVVQAQQDIMRAEASKSGAHWVLGVILGGIVTSMVLQVSGVTVYAALSVPVGAWAVGAGALVVGLALMACILLRQRVPKPIDVQSEGEVSNDSVDFSTTKAQRYYLLSEFSAAYRQSLAVDAHKPMAWCRKSRLDLSAEHLTLNGIFQHALKDGGGRTRRVLHQLKWLTGKDALGVDTSDEPVLSGGTLEPNERELNARKELLQDAYGGATNSR